MAIREVVINDTCVTIHECDDLGDPITGRTITGSWLWDSALCLSEWISEAVANNQVRISGATVLELGAGTGLPGLFAATYGASHVVLTDVGSLVPNLCANVGANGLEDLVQVMELKWGEDASMLGQVDVLLLSDLFYDPEEMPALAKTMHSVWAEGTSGYAASEVRDGVNECLMVLRQEGFEFHDVALMTRPLNGDSVETADFAVYVISRLSYTGLDSEN
ncbi:hypothetical protein LUZ63_009959 [Rhynchospora breviuscula]|uniref:Uncharacterized protein n=1 Tax=Rhynchospora breviuscula TaxID=2022672 RepID=A0A9Q0CG16_9POAL|nr:hypothetical protein LUZ63_009959 [Rhynchospora breviuscula]